MNNPRFEKEAEWYIVLYFALIPEWKKFVTIIAGSDSATICADQKSGMKQMTL